MEIERCFIDTAIIIVNQDTQESDYAKAVLTEKDLNNIARFSEWATKTDKGIEFNSTMLFYRDGTSCLLDHKFKDFKQKYYECLQHSASILEQSKRENKSFIERGIRFIGRKISNLFKVSKTN